MTITREQITEIAGLIGTAAKLIGGGNVDAVKASAKRLAAAVMADAPHVDEAQLLADLDAVIAKADVVRDEIKSE